MQYKYKYQEYQTKWTKKWRLNNREAQMIRVARASAKKKNIAFNIEVSDVHVPDTCPILGVPLFFTEGCRTDNTPSIDKIVPEKGYVKGNIQIVSWRANRLKSDASFEELIILGKWAEIELSKIRQ